MKQLSLSVFALLVLNGFNSQAQVEKYAETLKEDDLKRHLTYISSDEMEGRDTGSKGQKKVGQYIESHFKALDLKPIAPQKDGSLGYQQYFNLYKSGWKESYVIINGKKKVFFKDYYPVGLVNIPEEKAIETVFVGYGIKNENYNDYKGLKVKDKAVIFLEGSPNDPTNKLKLTASDWTGTNGTKQKAKIAELMGASFVFEVSAAEAEKFKTLGAERKAVLSRFNRMALKQSEKGNEATPMPTFVISEEMAVQMLDTKLKNLTKYKESLSLKSLKSKKKTSIKIKSERGEDLVETSNIMGFMEGTDHKDEVIVVSAHYDHVGIDDKGQIYNGADDDGSGTTAVLELAEAFAKAKAEGNGPKRSILFLLVTGEEKGLLGSRYFTDVDPIVPLNKIMCDINIDMIGRIDKKHANNENYVYVIGSDKLSSELHQISEEANKKSMNLELDYEFNDPKDPNRFYYRSDHYNFAKNNIPVVFYFTGVHEDYHKPTDDVEKIMFPKYNKIVKVIFYTIWDLGNRTKKIVVDSNKQ